MKILLVHNFYGSSAPSGENAVYPAERDLLQGHGHNVLEFTRHSDAIRNLPIPLWAESVKCLSVLTLSLKIAA